MESLKKIVDLPFVLYIKPLPNVVPENGVKAMFKANLVQGFPKPWKSLPPPTRDPDDIVDAFVPEKVMGHGDNRT